LKEISFPDKLTYVLKERSLEEEERLRVDGCLERAECTDLYNLNRNHTQNQTKLNSVA
jgi:hypothetical protein